MITPERLKELRSMPYAEYLKTPEWREKRAAKIALVGGRCQVCNADTQPLEAHHRTYERRGYELPSDITVLCADCHSLYHHKLPQAEAAG